MARLLIELDIETIPHLPLTEKEFGNTLQRRLGTILDSLMEARITAYEKIKVFQKKLKKRRPKKTAIPFEKGNLVLKYQPDMANVFGDKFTS